MYYEIKADVEEDKLEEALKESHRRCFVMNTLNPDIEIETTFEINN
ncbi:OsmC family protein [Orenia marismortui]|nr:OsmC family protein [Orenia marismortui]